MSPPILLCLIGLPASGKSHLATKLVHFLQHEKKLVPSTIIDIDNIRREMVTGPFCPAEEKEVIHEKFHRIEKMLSSHSLVIVDDVHYLASMRHDCLEIALKNNALYCSLYIKTPLSQCLQWNAARGYPIPDSVIQRMADEFDPPGNKYAWDRPRWIYSPSKENLDHFLTVMIPELVQLSTTQKSHIGSSTFPSFSKNQSDLLPYDNPQISLEQTFERESRELFGQIIRKEFPEDIIQSIQHQLLLHSSPIDNSSTFPVKLLIARRQKFKQWLMEQKIAKVSLDNFLAFLNQQL